MRKRIGIFGGTFNPIHMGHLMIAEFTREKYNLEEVIFVPSSNPPHKKLGIAAAEHRYKMTELAIADNPYFSISEVELTRKGPSYTIDTIKYFQTLYPKGTEFYFICGTDTILALPTWKYIDELLELCYFIGASRPDNADAHNVINSFGALGREKIKLLEVPKLKISATDLRERLQNKETVRYIVPETVINYINTHNFYKKEAQSC